MQEITDDIIQRAAQGDLAAFKMIYESSSSFVYNVAYRVLGHEADAKDASQEVFMILYNKLKDFRFESSFKTWVYRVTTNHCLNMAKKENRTRDHNSPYDEELHPVAVKPQITESINQEHHKNKVKELLDLLNPDQRACVILRHLENLSYEEIAQSLNININTVRTRLKRAREKMMSLKSQVDYV